METKLLIYIHHSNLFTRAASSAMISEFGTVWPQIPPPFQDVISEREQEGVMERMKEDRSDSEYSYESSEGLDISVLENIDVEEDL